MKKPWRAQNWLCGLCPQQGTVTEAKRNLLRGCYSIWNGGSGAEIFVEKAIYICLTLVKQVPRLFPTWRHLDDRLQQQFDPSRGKEWCRTATGNHHIAYSTCAKELVQTEWPYLLWKAGGGPQQAPCKDQGAVCSANSCLAVPCLQEKPTKVKDTCSLLQTPPCHPSLPRHAAPPQEATYLLPLKSLDLLAKAQPAPGGSGCPDTANYCRAAAQLWATTGPGGSRAGLPLLCPKCTLEVHKFTHPSTICWPQTLESRSHEVQRRGIPCTKTKRAQDKHFCCC